MHIAHVQGIFSPEHGGPTQSLSNYCQGQVAAGHRVELWTLEGYPHTSPAVRLPPPVEMHVFPVAAPAKLGRSAPLRRQLTQAAPADVYHLHGAWLRALHYGAVQARRHHRPYVVELMGTYETWARDQKWFQKRLARWWFQDRLLHGATCLHVNSGQEAQQLRDLGFRTPIAVLPVGVDLVELDRQLAGLPVAPLPDALLPTQPFLLFLSRLHPKKGLHLLIRAWARLLQSGVPISPELLLVIAGTGSPAYLAECRQLAEQLGVARRCRWLGYVDEVQKNWLLHHARCYVLPTSSENFGNVVAEALAHGTPVITTRHTPWADLETYRCGWLVDNTEPELCFALRQALALDDAARARYGQAGRRLVEEKYALATVLAKLSEVYEWLHGRRPRPDCLV